MHCWLAGCLLCCCRVQDGLLWEEWMQAVIEFHVVLGKHSRRSLVAHKILIDLGLTNAFLCGIWAVLQRRGEKIGGSAAP